MISRICGLPNSGTMRPRRGKAATFSASRMILEPNFSAADGLSFEINRPISSKSATAGSPFSERLAQTALAGPARRLWAHRAHPDDCAGCRTRSDHRLCTLTDAAKTTLKLPMLFPISGVHVDPLYLIVCGFVIGILGGFFGVGGSFLASPALFAAGIPMNFVVGTDLAHIVGKSIVAARRHRALGNIDLKLAVIMVVGTIAGSEMGVQAIEVLKKTANVTLVVGTVSIIVFTAISCFSAWESWTTLRMTKQTRAHEKNGSAKHDAMAFDAFPKSIQRIKILPVISLPHSGIESISFWAILLVSFVGGIFSGFLGGGAGYIRMPSMVYLLGIPTHVAVGTDLFEIIISASYGTIRHAMKGNVDILIALVMHTGAALGARIGANLTQFFTGPRIRLAFAPLPLLGAIVIAQRLMAGHHS